MEKRHEKTRHKLEQITPQAAPSGGSAGAGQEDGGGVPRAGHIERDILQVALGVWLHGGDQAKKLKSLEVENARLKRLVADLALDKRVLKDANEGNFQALNGSGVVWRLRASVMDCRSAGRVPRLVFGVLFRVIRSARNRMKRFVLRRQILSLRTAIA